MTKKVVKELGFRFKESFKKAEHIVLDRKRDKLDNKPMVSLRLTHLKMWISKNSKKLPRLRIPGNAATIFQLFDNSEISKSHGR